MAESIHKADVYTDLQGLTALRAKARNDDSEATLREVAGQFEALFLQMMLKSMREANLGEGLLDNEHTKTYQSMFDKQISIDMSTGRGIGLADVMVRQLSRSSSKAGSGADAIAVSETGAAKQFAENLRPLRTFQQAPVKRAEWMPENPANFVRDLWPHAQRTADDLGVRPEALIAQAALETGWGKHMIRSPDGQNSFNLFGIKADSSWAGQRVVTETVEFRDGLMRKERDSFRAYQSLGDSFSDYAEFLRSNPRYQQALQQADDAPSFTRALAEAGYATDPEYSTKINQIMNSARLKNAVSQIKVAGAEPLG